MLFSMSTMSFPENVNLLQPMAALSKKDMRNTLSSIRILLPPKSTRWYLLIGQRYQPEKRRNLKMSIKNNSMMKASRLITLIGSINTRRDCKDITINSMKIRKRYSRSMDLPSKTGQDSKELKRIN